jgi:hypothetical protein
MRGWVQQRDERLPSGTQGRDERRGRDHERLPTCRPRRAIDVPACRPTQEVRPEHQPGCRFEQDERRIGELVQRFLVVELGARDGIDSLELELGVDRVGSHPSGVKVSPDIRESSVVLATTEGARTMAGGQRGRLVEEEQLRETAGLHERTALPTAKLEPASDPPFPVRTTADAPRLIVEAATVPVDKATRGVRDQLAERCDPILKGHLGLTLDAHTQAPSEADRTMSQLSTRRPFLVSVSSTRSVRTNPTFS